jgi:hypothetical protein
MSDPRAKATHSQDSWLGNVPLAPQLYTQGDGLMNGQAIDVSYPWDRMASENQKVSI